MHRKVIGVAASLGVSQQVLRKIERKENLNAILTYGCMVLTVIIIIVFYKVWTASPAAIAVDMAAAVKAAAAEGIGSVAPVPVGDWD